MPILIHRARLGSLLLLLLGGCTLIGYDELQQVGGGGVITKPLSGGSQNTGGSVATGGQSALTGGANAGTGGMTTGGSDTGTGGIATGGTDTATGGADAGIGTGGMATGGADAGTGGMVTGGADAGTGGMATGGADAGVPDAGPIDAGQTNTYNSLLHRYDFAGSGTGVPDLVGTADGVLYDDTPMAGQGYADLDGVDDYVELPGGLLSPLQNFTLMIWMQWNGGACDQTLFSFGNHSGLASDQGTLVTSVGATPSSCSGTIGSTAAYIVPGTINTVYKLEDAHTGTGSFMALTIDRTNGRWRFDLDGYGAEFITTISIDNKLLPSGFANWVNTTSWLGRFQSTDYANFDGQIDEFRVYNRALTTAEIANCYALGPSVECDP